MWMAGGVDLKEVAYGFSEICKMVDKKNVFVTQKQITDIPRRPLLFALLQVVRWSKTCSERKRMVDYGL
jgi:hypothetical protein